AEKRIKPAPAPGTTPFTGFTWPFVVAGLVVLGLPVLLQAVDVLSEQLAGAFFGIAFFAVAVVVTGWPVVEGGGSRGLLAGVVLVTLLAVASAGIPIFKKIFPGDPAATASLTKTDEEKLLAGLGTGGDMDVVVHAQLHSASVS